MDWQWEEDHSLLLQVPAEVQLHIFSFLRSLNELIKVSYLCKGKRSPEGFCLTSTLFQELNTLITTELVWLLTDIGFNKFASLFIYYFNNNLLSNAYSLFFSKDPLFNGCVDREEDPWRESRQLQTSQDQPERLLPDLYGDFSSADSKP